MDSSIRAIPAFGCVAMLARPRGCMARLRPNTAHAFPSENRIIAERRRPEVSCSFLSQCTIRQRHEAV